jgi:hypothetical protein
MMSRKPTIPDDPVVAEVRRWRAQMEKEGGGTVEGVLRLVARRAAERADAARDRKPSGTARRRKGKGRGRAA